MKTVHIQKASPITEDKPVEDVSIIIDGMGPVPVKPHASFYAVKLYYEAEAKKLYEALRCSLPQGIIEPLIIEFMKNSISMYKGTMERTKDRDQ